MKKAGNTRLVYSTDHGRICPTCGQPASACTCRQSAARTSGDGILRVSREKAGRGGKTVTVVRGALLEAEALQALAKRLKTACGSGGTLKDGVVEIQGDHAERLGALLTQEGFVAKRAGG
ncbi:MAG: translation initiation factor Sui1 [Burkholderiales bacterium]